MPWKDVIYQYDGSFDGLLCCIFESYTHKERPTAIVNGEILSLFDVRLVRTDTAHARRVYLSLRRISPEVGPFLRRAFLTCLDDREVAICRFVDRLYRDGAPLLRRLTDETYHPLLRAVKSLNGEAELLRGFVRFSEFSGVLGAEIEPKNRVLPLLRGHFCARYRDESFFLYDRTHREALLYAARAARIVPLDSFTMAEPDENEAAYRVLWRRFYDTIAIRERENPRLRMSNMPRRYWGTLTELQPPTEAERRALDAMSAAPQPPQGRAAPGSVPAEIRALRG